MYMYTGTCAQTHPNVVHDAHDTYSWAKHTQTEGNLPRLFTPGVNRTLQQVKHESGPKRGTTTFVLDVLQKMLPEFSRFCTTLRLAAALVSGNSTTN